MLETLKQLICGRRKRPLPLVGILGLLSLSLVLHQLTLLTSHNLGKFADKESKVVLPARPAVKPRLLPTPILVVGLPKTGTTSIHAFFKRSGYRSSHFKCIDDRFCGLCIKAAARQGKTPLKSCGDYEVWAQMDMENLGMCHFPQIHNLGILHQEAPNATFLLSHRNMTRWVRSVKNWVGAFRSMAVRLAKCDGGPKSKKSQDLIQWHLEHVQRIRDFVKAHPSHALVEIDIEDPNAGEIMAQHFGSASPASNWWHENNGANTSASKLST